MARMEQFDVRSGPKTWQEWNNRMAVVTLSGTSYVSKIHRTINLQMN
ncbi:hypothetical protein [Sporosarcina sp. P26b]|nr:hypothetical protein [Sporosarcina sp. P26b]